MCAIGVARLGAREVGLRRECVAACAEMTDNRALRNALWNRPSAGGRERGAGGKAPTNLIRMAKSG